LAVQGVVSVWRHPKPLIVAAALAVMTVPGFVHKVQASANSIHVAGDPFFVFPDEVRALKALEADPRARGLHRAVLVDAELEAAGQARGRHVRGDAARGGGAQVRRVDQRALDLRGLPAGPGQPRAGAAPAAGTRPAVRVRGGLRAALPPGDGAGRGAAGRLTAVD